MQPRPKTANGQTMTLAGFYCRFLSNRKMAFKTKAALTRIIARRIFDSVVVLSMLIVLAWGLSTLSISLPVRGAILLVAALAVTWMAKKLLLDYLRAPVLRRREATRDQDPSAGKQTNQPDAPPDTSPE